MSRNIITALVAGWALAGVALNASAANFSFQGLGIAPGQSWSEASDVSADGRVVVGQNRNPSSVPIGFRWTRDEGMSSLGDSGNSSSFAIAVSGDGSVIVGSATQNYGAENYAAYRWTAASGRSYIANTPNLFPTQAGAITPNGQVIVGSAGTPQFYMGSNTNVSYYWTAATGPVSIGDLPGGIIFSGASGISADGSAITGFGRGVDGNRAYLWTANTGMVDLGDLPGGHLSLAYDISADGSTVVGQGRITGGGISSEAFRWTSQTGMVGLGYLADGYRFSQANDVSGDGSVVVGMTDVGSFLPSHAFLWTVQGGMVDLRDYLVAHGATGLSGWILTEATAITPDGRTIVGKGTNPFGKTEAWIATIPEPSSWLLLAAALLTLGGRRPPRVWPASR